MLDISRKHSTLRIAVAEATLKLAATTMALIQQGRVPKGNPLEVAKVAAIQAAKGASQLIPYCHPLPIQFVGVEFALQERAIRITATVKAIHQTGVEMEALTAAAVAALTLYDMLKMLDQTMEIDGVRLVEKRGGNSDFTEAREAPLRAAVLVISDSVAAGEREDQSGRLIVERLRAVGAEIAEVRAVPDEVETIAQALRAYADEMGVDLIMTTGGTGFGPRDTTPEAMARVTEREVPGIPEALRAHGQARTPYAMLSRGRAGIRGRTIIINLPGSPRGVAEALDALFPGLLHAFSMLRGGGHPRQESPDGEAG